MICPYCGMESQDEVICSNCGSNIANFNKIKEASDNSDIYTRRIIIKICLISFILFICIFSVILLLV
jgi:uncharacterized membrane protein YvbJ